IVRACGSGQRTRNAGFSWGSYRRLTARSWLLTRVSGVSGDGGGTGRRPEFGGRADIVYVLCLMQAAFLLLGALGELLLMGGSPLYLALPVVKIVLLLVLAAKT